MEVVTSFHAAICWLHTSAVCRAHMRHSLAGR